MIGMRQIRTVALAAALPAAAAAPAPETPLGNKPERLEWFRDLGFGIFVHWSHDSQIGSVISHSLVGADADFSRRFFERLPASFNPRKYHPQDWAVLARLAGAKYVVFTTKHHSGFCMYDTRTTSFSVMHTPYGKDVTAELVRALRAEGLAVGFYFSPDDFHYLHSHGKAVARPPHPGVSPQEDPGLLEYDRAQLRELLTNYGPVDMVFLDGPAEGLKQLVWELQPDALVTRGAIETPEQTIPGVPLDRPWEACITMGTQWQYKPAHESYKSGTQLIEMLIETRAKGGNLLLNVGPKPDGELPIEQEERLREIALWSFTFGEALEAVRPWVVTNEGDVWFTKKKDADTVYAIVTQVGNWQMGDRRRFTLRSLAATERTRVRVLGQSGEVLEYRPDVDPSPRWSQDEAGLHLDVMMAQRLYNDRRWPNPVAIELTHVQPALTPPVVETGDASLEPSDGGASLAARLVDLGGVASVEVGFQYRRKKRTEELYGADEPWRDTPLARRASTGDFTTSVEGLSDSETYEFRAVVKHTLVTVYGEERPVPPR
jgi:alpha-L-fucosidase